MMKAARIIALGITLVSLQGQEPAVPAVEIRFRTLDVFVDSDAQPLAAYQLKVIATQGDVKIVGIEGGEHPAFMIPPYYDPKAMQTERAILGAFSTSPAEQLPRGRTRVATLHVQITGTTQPNFKTEIEAAASSDGRLIAVQVSLVERNVQ